MPNHLERAVIAAVCVAGALFLILGGLALSH